MTEKRFRIQDRILLGLALVGDLYFEIFEPYSLQLKKLKGILPPDYKATNFAAGVRRLLKTSFVEKVFKDGEPYLRLTSAGKGYFKREISLSSLKKKGWDKRWRLVFYDIEEIERRSRDVLREKLLELGFGQIQESIYISPYPLADDMREFLEHSGLGKKVFVAVVERLLAGDEKELAQNVWQLGEINRLYKELIGEFETAKAEERKSFKFCRTLRAKFLEIHQTDPLLPEELLPSDWVGDRVRKLIRNFPA